MYWCSSSASARADVAVVAERLLHHHSRRLGEPGLGEPLHHRAEQERRDLQVEHRRARVLDLGADALVGRGVGEVALHVGQAAPRTGRTPRGRAPRPLPTIDVPGALDELVEGPVVDRDADDRASSSLRRSRRYSDRNVITRARSPVIPKITNTSPRCGASIRLPVVRGGGHRRAGRWR